MITRVFTRTIKSPQTVSLKQKTKQKVAHLSFFLSFLFLRCKRMIQSSNTAAEDAPLLANNEHHLINQPRYHSSNDDRLHYEEQQPPRIKGPAGDRSWVKTHKMRLFFISIILVILFVLSILADALKAASFSYNDINTIISFGDSYTTRYLDMESLSYLCRNCTSAGGPNWVIYLTDSTGWLSFDFAYNSAPVNNSIVNQVSIYLLMIICFID
jgi:hypothetical protein